jgi:hypothetical protein
MLPLQDPQDQPPQDPPSSSRRSLPGLGDSGLDVEFQQTSYSLQLRSPSSERATNLVGEPRGSACSSIASRPLFSVQDGGVQAADRATASGWEREGRRLALKRGDSVLVWWPGSCVASKRCVLTKRSKLKAARHPAQGSILRTAGAAGAADDCLRLCSLKTPPAMLFKAC